MLAYHPWTAEVPPSGRGQRHRLGLERSRLGLSLTTNGANYRYHPRTALCYVVSSSPSVAHHDFPSLFDADAPSFGQLPFSLDDDASSFDLEAPILAPPELPCELPLLLSVEPPVDEPEEVAP